MSKKVSKNEDSNNNMKKPVDTVKAKKPFSVKGSIKSTKDNVKTSLRKMKHNDNVVDLDNVDPSTNQINNSPKKSFTAKVKDSINGAVDKTKTSLKKKDDKQENNMNKKEDDIDNYFKDNEEIENKETSSKIKNSFNNVFNKTKNIFKKDSNSKNDFQTNEFSSSNITKDDVASAFEQDSKNNKKSKKEIDKSFEIKTTNTNDGNKISNGSISFVDFKSTKIFFENKPFFRKINKIIYFASAILLFFVSIFFNAKVGYEISGVQFNASNPMLGAGIAFVAIWILIFLIGYALNIFYFVICVKSKPKKDLETFWDIFYFSLDTVIFLYSFIVAIVDYKLLYITEIIVVLFSGYIIGEWFWKNKKYQEVKKAFSKSK